jgi:glutathione S-transferase
VKIYGNKFWGNPRRVSMFLAEKGIDVPFVDVDLRKGEHRTPEFLRRNPAGLVPVLELDDGTCLAETLAICRYLEELHPAPSLFGRTPLERAQVEMWQRIVEFKVYTPAREYFRHISPSVSTLEPRQIKEWGELNQQRALDGMALLDQQLARAEFIAGSLYSVADITALFTFEGLARLGGLEIGPRLPHLQRWFAAVSQRPSAVATRAPAPAP